MIRNTSSDTFCIRAKFSTSVSVSLGLDSTAVETMRFGSRTRIGSLLAPAERRDLDLVGHRQRREQLMHRLFLVGRRRRDRLEHRRVGVDSVSSRRRQVDGREERGDARRARLGSSATISGRPHVGAYQARSSAGTSSRTRNSRSALRRDGCNRLRGAAPQLRHPRRWSSTRAARGDHNLPPSPAHARRAGGPRAARRP